MKTPRSIRNFQERKANQDRWIEYEGKFFEVVRARRCGQKGDCFNPWAIEPMRDCKRSWKNYRKTQYIRNEKSY